MFRQAFQGKTVFVTGHTGFKGSWLSLWLGRLGARVVGLALAPPTEPSLFDQAGMAGRITHVEADIREARLLERLLLQHQPAFVFHLAAQSLVRRSYQLPFETFAVNTLGVAALLDAVRATAVSTTVVVVTSDKCYANREWDYAYREADRLGGQDPYSASKAAAELVIEAYRRSFFSPKGCAEHGVLLASARSGNVIGGGDWSPDRLVPDAIRAFTAGEPLRIRNPDAVRPWQHVLEPLSGYLWLAARLSEPGGQAFAESWNFGPRFDDAVPVRELAEALCRAWGAATWSVAEDAAGPPEARTLRLSIDKAKARLGWRPVWDLPTAVERTVRWYRDCRGSTDPERVVAACLDDIAAHQDTARRGGLPWAT